MSGTKGMTHYSLAIKLQAVDLHGQEGMPYAQVADQLGIRKAERIEKWCRAYRREGEVAFHRPIGRPRKDEPEQVTLARLRMENALLKNSDPSCTELCSRGAISGHRTLPRNLPGECNV